MSEETSSQSNDQATKRSQDTKKTDSYKRDESSIGKLRKMQDSYKSDNASIGTLQAGAADEGEKPKRDSFESDKDSIGKLKETLEKKSESKNEQREGKEG